MPLLWILKPGLDETVENGEEGSQCASTGVCVSWPVYICCVLLCMRNAHVSVNVSNYSYSAEQLK